MRFDFDAPGRAETADLFQGRFSRASKAKWIYSFPPGEFELGNAVKWAIESATGIRCLYCDRDLLAEAAPGTANRLTRIAEQISQNFRALIAKYSTVNGASVSDRQAFIMGLYDGMMNELRDIGQPLPSRPGSRRKSGRVKKPAVSPATGLHLHPYSLALGLGRQIRFSVPLQEITAELDGLVRARLTNEVFASNAQGRMSKARPALAG